MTHNKLNTDQQHYIACLLSLLLLVVSATENRSYRFKKKHTRLTDKSGQLSLNRRCLNKPPPTHK